MKTRRKIKAVKMCSVDDCDCCKRIRRYYKRCVACETNLIARNTKIDVCDECTSTNNDIMDELDRISNKIGGWDNY